MPLPSEPTTSVVGSDGVGWWRTPVKNGICAIGPPPDPPLHSPTDPPGDARDGRIQFGMNEGDLLGHIYGATRGMVGSFSRVVVGPGDDCAVVQTPGGDHLLLSVDQLIAGRHFAPDESHAGIERIAYKAVARSLSDIAAMGGTPTVSLAATALPASYTQGDALFDAMHRAACAFDCPLVGGDIALTDGPMTLSVTVVGATHPQRGPVLRSEARVGDGVYVTGALGGSFASGRHLSFTPRLVEGAWLCAQLDGGRGEQQGERLGAMIDLSDGLGRDAGRMAEASGVVIELEADRLPMHADVTDPMRALSDGEDYELCFTARGDVPGVCEATGTPISRVGVVAEAGEVGGAAVGRCTMRLTTGEVVEAGDMGWEHRA